MKQDLSVADRFFLDSDQSQAAWVYLTRAAGRRARVDWHKVAPWASAVSVGCRVDIKGSCSWCYLGLQAERTRARAACRLYKTFHIARKKACLENKYGCSHNVPCCLNWRQECDIFLSHFVYLFKCCNKIIFLYQAISTYDLQLLAFKSQQMMF